jgi:MFS family permease
MKERRVKKEIFKIIFCVLLSFLLLLFALFLFFFPSTEPWNKVFPAYILIIKFAFPYALFGAFFGAFFSSIFFHIFIKGKRGLNRFFSSLFGLLMGIISAAIGGFLLFLWFAVLSSRTSSDLCAGGAFIVFAIYSFVLLILSAIVSGFIYGILFGYEKINGQSEQQNQRESNF